MSNEVNFNLLFWIVYIVWSATHMWVGRKDRWLGKDVNQERGSKSTVAIVSGILAGVLIVFLLSKRLPSKIGPEWLRWVGLAVAVVGMILNLWAIRTLGRFFKTIIVVQDKHQLVTAGPYKYFRHPSYFASMVILLGMGLMLNNAWGLLIVLVLPFVTFVYRIRVEEKTLRRTFGEAFVEYAAKRWAIIPFVW